MAIAEELDHATDSKWDWVAQHTRTYLASGGTEGHESNGVRTLVQATTGRRSGTPAAPAPTVRRLVRTHPGLAAARRARPISHPFGYSPRRTSCNSPGRRTAPRWCATRPASCRATQPSSRKVTPQRGRSR
jgi:hypothetical protein